jgi:hypothetical protein
MSRRAVRATCLLALAACGGPPSPIAFNPTPDVAPRCSPGKTLDYQAWKEWNTELAAFAKDVGAESDDYPIVLDKLRADVRYLADGEGCVIEGGYGNAPFDLKCGQLQPSSKAKREQLLATIRTRIPRLKALEAKLQSCTMSFYSFGSEADSAAAGRGGTCEVLKHKDPSAPPTFAIAAGCTFQNPGPCETGCAHGNADACSTLASARQNDPLAEVDARLRGCEARLASNPLDAKKAGSDCNIAILVATNKDKPLVAAPANIARATKLLDRACELIPSSPACRVALWEKNPTYDPERAVRAARALFESSEPASAKVDLLNYKASYYDVARAKAVLSALEQECAANADTCYSRRAFFDPKAPHFDAGAAKRVFDAVDALCATTKNAAQCGQVIYAYKRDGFRNEPAKALELAKKLCESSTVDGCWSLISCYETGDCGAPKDEAKVKEVATSACNALAAKHPNVDWSTNPMCTRAGLAPKPAKP